MRVGSSVVALTLIATAAPLHAQQPSSATTAQRFKQLVESTQLDHKGAQPFHLKIDAQIYNLVGRAAETGTIEEWWAAPGEYRIETNSGSLHQIVDSGQPSAATEDTRTSYLLALLLEATVHPLEPFARSENLTLDKRKYGKATLACYQYGPPKEMSSACVDPSNGMLRAQTLRMEAIVRNSVGVFHGTGVALAINIAFIGHDVVSGKITTLQGFTPGVPGTPTLQSSPPVADASDHSTTAIAGGVISGHLLKPISPEYPPVARQAHISGTVLLHATITKEGTISKLFVLASPDESLSRAAMSAVSAARYKPYLLNGKPVEVDTTITINFNLSG